jgi:hypothetical protein
MFVKHLGKINLTIAIGHGNNKPKQDLTIVVID